MFKHILLPTDGSEFSTAAIHNGLKLAKLAGAGITAFYVVPEFHTYTHRVEVEQEAKQRFAKNCEAHAQQVLSIVVDAAKAAGIQCDTAWTISDHPYEAIIETSIDKACDLIVMASHGRSGVSGLLLGSETQKVLTHSKIPVLVYR